MLTLSNEKHKFLPNSTTTAVQTFVPEQTSRTFPKRAALRLGSERPPVIMLRGKHKGSIREKPGFVERLSVKTTSMQEVFTHSSLRRVRFDSKTKGSKLA
jgi:hypothetical protein